MADEEPGWLRAMRAAAVQRPRTRFQKIEWAHLQLLLRERDYLWYHASDETRQALAATRSDDYTYR